MIDTKGITAILLGVNLLFIGMTLLHQVYQTPRVMMIQDFKPINGTYYFENPEIAHKILKQLDVWSVLRVIPGSNYNISVMSWNKDYEYCDKHRELIVHNPEIIFEQKNIVTNFWATHKLRTMIIPKYGKDITKRLTKPVHWNLSVPLNANLFIMHNLFYNYRQIGTQFSCLSQASNHIAGHDKLYRKDMATQATVDYLKSYKKKPQCVGYDKYFIKTYILKNKGHCQEFFKHFLSPEYQKLKEERNIVYFRKIGADSHQGSGVFPVNDQETTYIRELYADGAKCGEIKKNNLIQLNIHNLLLVEKRKFGFRSFLLIASTNPFIAFYHDGYARLSLNSYDAQSNDTSTFVTNINLNLQHSEYANWTDAQIQNHTYWPLERFNTWINEKGIVNDPDWLNNYLRPEFMKVKIHLIRMAQSGFFKKSSMYEIYGIDYVMDEDLKLWFIEANTMPLMNGFTPHSTKLFNTMLKDSFEIIQGLIKSRMKRAIFYVNNLVRTIGDGEIPDLAQKQKEFGSLTKNHFEPEFEPRANNTFYKIVDENYDGVKRYSGIIEPECLSFK